MRDRIGRLTDIVEAVDSHQEEDRRTVEEEDRNRRHLLRAAVDPIDLGPGTPSCDRIGERERETRRVRVGQELELKSTGDEGRSLGSRIGGKMME